MEAVDFQGAYNLLQSYTCGVLDLRSPKEIHKSHILEAQFFHNTNWGSLRMREEILVYGSSIAHVQDQKGEVLAKLRGPRSKFRVLYLFAAPFEEFVAKFPFLCGASAPETSLPSGKKITSVRVKRPRYPSEIIEGCLYHGHKMDASRPEVMQNLKITHIVNATRTTPCFFEHEEEKDSPIHGLKYLRLVLDDVDDDDLSEALERGPAFIQDAVRSGGKVLVHCQEGLSRSSAVVLAYLLCASERTLAEAMIFLGRCRPIVQPNEGYVDQLARFEIQLRPECLSSRLQIPSKFIRPRPVGTSSTLAKILSEQQTFSAD